MKVTINGETRELERGTTVAELIAQHSFKPKHVAVEINLDLVPRGQFQATRLEDGDQVEIVTLVGGG